MSQDHIGIQPKDEKHYYESRRYHAAIDAWAWRDELLPSATGAGLRNAKRAASKAKYWREWWNERYGDGETLDQYMARVATGWRPEALQIVKRLDAEDALAMAAQHNEHLSVDQHRNQGHLRGDDRTQGALEFEVPDGLTTADGRITSAAGRAKHAERMRKLREAAGLAKGKV